MLIYSDQEIKQLKKILTYYDVKPQLEMLIEEMGEAAVSIQHFKRIRNNLTDVMSELIDVHIVLSQILMLFSDSEKQTVKSKKIKREIIRIYEKKNNKK